jgi:DNA-binding NtrC family response regulator
MWEKCLEGKRLLIVDDDDATAMAYRALFEASDPRMVVDVVLTAEAALPCVLHGSYDVILSDQRLPRLDGLGLLIACHLFHPGTRFILVTAHGDRTLEEKATSLGIYAFLHKPVDNYVLLNTVQRACGRSIRPCDSATAHDHLHDRATPNFITAPED